MPSAFTAHIPTARLDLDAIKAHVDLEALAVALLGEPPGRKGGGRLWWSCPFHDDPNPSFVVDPGRGRWNCYGCRLHGDAFDFVMRLERSAFPDAVRRVAEVCGFTPSERKRNPTHARKPTEAIAKRLERPSSLLLAEALALVDEAAKCLWGPKGLKALAYLRGRGLTDETVRAARLGFVESARVPRKDGVGSYRASGIVLPWLDGERLALVKIRQLDEARPKYVEAFRDRPSIFPGPEAIQPVRKLIVVEGEFDALVMSQQPHHMAGVVTLGSAASRLDEAVRRAVKSCPSVFMAHDADAAGDKAAECWPSRAVRVRPPEGFNDWTEVHASGFNRIRYIMGRHLPMSIPWQELAGKRWGPALSEANGDEPDAYAVAERLAIKSEPPLTGRA